VCAGEQDVPGAGRAPGPGSHVAGGEAQGVGLHGEQQRDGPGPGRSWPRPLPGLTWSQTPPLT